MKNVEDDQPQGQVKVPSNGKVEWKMIVQDDRDQGQVKVRNNSRVEWKMIVQDDQDQEQAKVPSNGRVVWMTNVNDKLPLGVHNGSDWKVKLSDTIQRLIMRPILNSLSVE
jgi:hypothetical protein